MNMKSDSKDLKRLTVPPSAKFEAASPGKGLRVLWARGCEDEPIIAVQRDFFKEFVPYLSESDPAQEADETLQLAFQVKVLVVAGGIIVGPFPDRLVGLTGYPRPLVEVVCERMLGVGIWQERSTHAEWIDGDYYDHSTLWCHSLVAGGLLTAKWEPTDHKWVYEPLPWPPATSDHDN
jgi:hypothetical protein